MIVNLQWCNYQQALIIKWLRPQYIFTITVSMELSVYTTLLLRIKTSCSAAVTCVLCMFALTCVLTEEPISDTVLLGITTWWMSQASLCLHAQTTKSRCWCISGWVSIITHWCLCVCLVSCNSLIKWLRCSTMIGSLATDWWAVQLVQFTGHWLATSVASDRSDDSSMNAHCGYWSMRSSRHVWTIATDCLRTGTFSRTRPSVVI